VLSKAREGKLHDKRFHDEDDIASNVPDEIPIEVDLGFQGLQNQYENIAIAARALTVANEKRNLAYTKRDDAFRKLSTEVLKGAAKGGATAADQDKIRTAIMAQPIIEKLIGKINEMNSAVSLPSYTEESGRGAALATNTDDFVYHLSILKGNKTVLEDGKNTWESRLADIKQLSGV